MFEDHRILIVGGSGGVGKTSLSAALGVSLACRGYKTLVLTIDPARRLAGALGLDRIGAEAVELTSQLAEAGLAPSGSLHAMMLDVQNTFDRLVRRYAPDAETTERILNNRLYQNISTRLSGSQEYASMQRLYEISVEGGYDRIVLDTPPTTHALEFLTAPRRLTEFFDSRVMQLFLNFGGRTGMRLLRRGTDMFFSAVERLTGPGLIREIADFFQLAEAILEPYKQQADRAEALLRSHETTFLIVSGANGHQLDEAHAFRSALSRLSINVSGLIVNRWLAPVTESERVLDQVQPDDALAGTAVKWFRRIERWAHMQTAQIEKAADGLDIPVVRVPVMDEDIHTVTGLHAVADYLQTQG